MKQYKYTKLLLKLSIASVFLYAAVAATLQPDNWASYFPNFLVNIVPIKLLLIGFSGYQVILALWIISGKYLFYASLLAALTLVAIIIANLTALDVVFRDIAIFFAALALAGFSSPRTNGRNDRY